jgi:hypothetical protein
MKPQREKNLYLMKALATGLIRGHRPECPLRKYRKLPVGEIEAKLNELSDEQLEAMVRQHFACIRFRECQDHIQSSEETP